MSLTNNVKCNFIIPTFAYWNNLFSDDELHKIENIMNQKELNFGSLGSDVESKTENSEIRNSKINFHSYNADTSWIFDRLNYIIERTNSESYKFDLYGYNEIQYSEYNSDNNGHYDWHCDMHYNSIQTETRKLSVVLMLNKPNVDFTGGEFEINTGDQNYPLDIKFEKGGVALFPSFVHHRVTPVTSGIRKSIVTWVTGPKFK
jgi:PKHD-type hydroxylase